MTGFFSKNASSFTGFPCSEMRMVVVLLSANGRIVFASCAGSTSNAFSSTANFALSKSCWFSRNSSNFANAPSSARSKNADPLL